MIQLAPAKINLRLEIIGRRPDGYHLLQSVMVPISLYDELTFSPAATGVQFTCSDPGLPTGDDNLVVRAAKAILSAASCSRGVKIHLDKNIPSAAGLGGGSSDAATTLMSVRDLFSLAISDERLHDLAAGLGADVPFFLYRSACLVEGIGEKVSKYTVASGLPVALIKPAEGLSTPRVYQALNWPLTHHRKAHNLPASLGDLHTVCAWLRNDLEAPAEALLPRIADGKKLLRDQGATGVQMSGSGPTIFGIFNRQEEAVQACDDAKRQGWWAFACSTR
ncbi:MAG: 4-(cytidine 5'-diphospho)-2-C-methyl-D-erythritol kinase [Myxococcales bacterium]|nr:4-(cytidine 5'-diphospho)-2-C-methyl-D-erythritol kinase [Myxococcales bacterium]